MTPDRRRIRFIARVALLLLMFAIALGIFLYLADYALKRLAVGDESLVCMFALVLPAVGFVVRLLVLRRISRWRRRPRLRDMP